MPCAKVGHEVAKVGHEVAKVGHEVAKVGHEDRPAAKTGARIEATPAESSDDSGFVELFQRLRAYVRLKSGPLVRARESASDLLQSICREVLSDLSGIDCDSEAAFRGWLFRVAHNKILHRVAYHSADKRGGPDNPGGPTPAGGDEPGVLDAYATFSTPSRHAKLREGMERIESAMDRLPGADRDVILQARIIGRSHREIATDLGKSEEAVRQMLTRARSRLGLLLER